jgi:hypothetical protein
MQLVAGVDNVGADALSQLAAAMTSPSAQPVYFEQLELEQRTCADTNAASSREHVACARDGD